MLTTAIPVFVLLGAAILPADGGSHSIESIKRLTEQYIQDTNRTRENSTRAEPKQSSSERNQPTKQLTKPTGSPKQSFDTKSGNESGPETRQPFPKSPATKQDASPPAAQENSATSSTSSSSNRTRKRKYSSFVYRCSNCSGRVAAGGDEIRMCPHCGTVLWYKDGPRDRKPRTKEQNEQSKTLITAAIIGLLIASVGFAIALVFSRRSDS